MCDTRLPVCAVLLALALGPTTLAQAPPLFSAATDLVVLNVRVTDRRGAYVAGLPEQAFTVFEDGRRQAIQAFSAEDAPVTVGLIVDSSISMWSIRDLLIDGSVAFAEASNASDEMFAMAFNERSWSALPGTAPFTSSPKVLGAALAAVIQPRGRTALYDAVKAGLDYTGRGSHTRKVLTVISDGGDNASTSTLDEVLALTLASNVVIYGVALVDPVENGADPKVLKRLADVSGGEMFAPRSAADLRSSLHEAARQVRQAYMVGYVPLRPRDGAYHQLRVEVAAQGRGALSVRTRSGYLSGRTPLDVPGGKTDAR